MKLGLDLAADGFNFKEGFFGIAVLEKKLTKDTQAVTALFSLAAVRVINAELSLGRTGFFQSQNAVRTHAGIAVANPDNVLRSQFERENGWVHHEIVVSQPVGTDKLVWGEHESPLFRFDTQQVGVNVGIVRQSQ